MFHYAVKSQNMQENVRNAVTKLKMSGYAGKVKGNVEKSENVTSCQKMLEDIRQCQKMFHNAV